MSFTLRKGESITRFFAPEQPGLFYLPYAFDGVSWKEFPQEAPEFHIRTADGPRSQKDHRTWATGRIDYDTSVDTEARNTIIDMPSPYVIIDAQFILTVQLAPQSRMVLETSIDRGIHWIEAGNLHGPYRGIWRVQPKVLVRSAHGRLTAVSGAYGYQLRIRTRGSAEASKVHFTTRFQLNPRSLPAVEPGANLFHFSTGPAVERIEFPAGSLRPSTAFLRVADEHAQTIRYPERGRSGQAIYTLEDPVNGVTGFDVGVRFLDMPDGRAPDKLTAEVRPSAIHTRPGPAGIAWSTSIDGPYRDLWTYDAEPHWLDGQPISRLLRWPEVFRHVENLSPATKHIYVKIYTAGPAFDSVRFALYHPSGPASGEIAIVQKWHQGAIAKQHTASFPAATAPQNISLQAGPSVRNDSLTFICR